MFAVVIAQSDAVADQQLRSSAVPWCVPVGAGQLAAPPLPPADAPPAGAPPAPAVAAPALPPVAAPPAGAPALEAPPPPKAEVSPPVVGAPAPDMSPPAGAPALGAPAVLPGAPPGLAPAVVDVNPPKLAPGVGLDETQQPAMPTMPRVVAQKTKPLRALSIEILLEGRPLSRGLLSI
jgi:hypothetical protein